MDVESFFRELRRRHVYRVAAAYAIVSWILIQVVATTFPYLGLPQWSIRTIIVIALMGFPWALVLAWAFDFTRKGIIRARTTVDSAQEAHKGHAVLVGVLGFTLAALEGAGYWYWSSQHQHAVQAVTQRAKSYSALIATQPSIPIAPNSVAVLPFENLSSDPNNVYFTAGIQDQILTDLAHIHALKVISRTSTERYKSHPQDLRTVSRELGVANVLEGSVQKFGNRVRINVQLIDAKNDQHIWAKNYDRILKDIFEVETDVAEKIAASLKATLLPTEVAAIARLPTNKPEVYNDFLKAEYFYRAGASTGNVVSNRKAIRLYHDVTKRDPTLALAWAHLSISLMRLYWWGISHTKRQLSMAKEAADHAVHLQPNLPDVYRALGYYDYWGHLDYTAALAQFRAANRLVPNDAQTLASIGYINRRLGYWDKALAILKKATSLDPRNAHLHLNIGVIYLFTQRYTHAIKEFTRALALAPDNGEAASDLIATYLLAGQMSHARVLLDSIPRNIKGAIYLYQWKLVMAQLSRHYQTLLRLIDTAPPGFFQIAGGMPKSGWLGFAYKYEGNHKNALSALSQAQQKLIKQVRKEPTNPLLLSNLGLVDAGLGRRGRAIREGRKAVQLRPPSKDAFTGPALVDNLAKIYAQLGEAGTATATLRQLFDLTAQAQESPATLRLDPVWDPVRRDPRFQDLVKDRTMQSN